MKYKFVGKNIIGETVEDFITASSQEEVIELLKARNIKISTLFVQKETGADTMAFLNSFFEKASQKDIVNMSRQVSALLEAGVSIPKSFNLLATNAPKPFLKKVFEEIMNDIKSGSPISKALAKHPKIFDDFYVNMVRSGEESGKIANSFSYLAEYQDRSYALTSKVKNAMIYPAFVIATFIIVMILVFTMVVPKLAVILNESGVELPLLTRLVLGFSDFLVNYGLYLFVGVFGFGLYFWVKFKDSEVITETMDNVKLKIPVIKDIFMMMYMTRIADNIQTLLTSGVSLPKSIQITADVVGNIYYKSALQESLNDIRGGVTFSESLSKHPELMSPTMLQMLKIGEETGETTKLLGNVAKFYQREINGMIDTLVGLIEPMMIVLLGLGVGVLLVSVLMPIYNLAGAF